MNKAVLPFLALLFLCFGTASAGELRHIELTDGSSLTGEVISYANGVYTVRTASLGTIAIEDGKVRSISAPDVQAPASSPPEAGVRSLQERMESDPQIMETIRSLKDDPSFRQVLEDPEILKAMENGDMAALMASPKFMRLLDNSKVLDIKSKLDK
jgi:hypothetical protein